MRTDEEHREHREADLESQRRERWLRQRRTGIGASEVGILFGVSIHGSLLSLWADKTGRPTAERTPQAELAMRVGNHFEGFVCEEAEKETGFKISRNHDSAAMSGHPLVRATTDGFAYPEDGDRGCMDAKTVGEHNSAEWRDGIIPLAYNLQLQTQMAVTGCSWALIAGLLLGDSRLVCLRLEFDPELAEIIVARVEWFWRTYVEADVAPPVDDRTVTTAALAALHPRDNGMMVPLGLPLEHAARELVAAKQEAAALKKRIALRENQLRLGLADATFGSFPDGTGVSLKTQTHGSGSTFRVLRSMKPKAVERERKACDERLEKILGGT